MSKVRNYFNFRVKDLFFSPVEDLKVKKLDNAIFYISFVSSILAVYVLSVQKNDMILHVKKCIFVLIPFAMGLRLFFTKKMNIWFFPLAAIVGGYALVFNRFDSLGEFILLSWSIFSFSFKPSYKITENQIRVIVFFLCGVISLHFYFFENYHRESIGGLDPNYSSYLIFILLPFAIFSNSTAAHVLISGLGILTQSRAFFVAIILYCFLRIFFKLFKGLKYSFRDYLLTALVLFLMLILYSYYSFSRGENLFGESIAYGFERLFYILNNPSDFQRWKANVVFFQLASKNTNFLMVGMDPLLYLKTINLFLPHNIPLLELATHGVIVGSIFLILFTCFIKRIFNLKYISFFLAILVYWLLLGVEIGAIYTVFLINLMILLNTSERNGSDH